MLVHITHTFVFMFLSILFLRVLGFLVLCSLCLDSFNYRVIYIPVGNVLCICYALWHPNKYRTSIRAPPPFLKTVLLVDFHV